MPNTGRVVCWFSAGAASAVATKLALADYGDECVVASIDPGSEHPDNERFIAECEEWFGVPILRLRSEIYVDTWDVWERTRYLVGPTGARCTGELKKRVRKAFERPDDRHVFGYTADPREITRARRFREQNPGVELLTPLIDRNLTKNNCLALIDRANIEVPMMYRLGYQNNNCVGCPKGGMGYWNKIRRDFPEVFDRMAKVERSIGATCLREKGAPLYLDTLDPDRGRHVDEPSFECGPACEIVEEQVVIGSRPGNRR